MSISCGITRKLFLEPMVPCGQRIQGQLRPLQCVPGTSCCVDSVPRSAQEASGRQIALHSILYRLLSEH